MPTTYTPNGSIYDDFRPLAVATAINGRTSDSGHTWVSLGSAGSWAVVTGGPEGHAAGGSNSHDRVGINFGSADVYIEAVVRLSGTGTGGISFRNASNAFYAVGITATNTVTLAKITNALIGSSTTLATWTPSPLAVDGDWVAVDASGSTISVYFNGTLLGSVTDAAITGTNHGLYQRFSGTNPIYAFNMHPPPRGRGLVVGSMTLN